MSWWNKSISEMFESAAGVVGRIDDYAVTYTVAAAATIGGAALDVVDKAVEGAGYLADKAGVESGKNWDLYEGSAAKGVIDFVADGRANAVAEYMHTNPDGTMQAMQEGLQHGLGSVAGTLTGVVAGAGGLIADTGNMAAWGVGKLFGQQWGYDGYATIDWFSGTNGAVSGAFVDGTDWVGEKLGGQDLAFDDMTPEQRVIFSTTKGATEVVADVAIIAATAGTAGGVIAGARAGGGLLSRSAAGYKAGSEITGKWLAATATTGGAILVTADAAVSVTSVNAESEQKFEDMVAERGQSLDFVFGS